MSNINVCKTINTIGTPSLKALIAGRYKDANASTKSKEPVKDKKDVKPVKDKKEVKLVKDKKEVKKDKKEDPSKTSEKQRKPSLKVSGSSAKTNKKT